MVKLCFTAGSYPVVVMINPSTMNGYLEPGFGWDKIRVSGGRLDNEDGIYECPSDLQRQFPKALKEAILERCDEYLKRPFVKKDIRKIIEADMEIDAMRSRHREELEARVETRDQLLHRVLEGARLFGGFKLKGYATYGSDYESQIAMLSHRGENLVEEWHADIDLDDYEPQRWEWEKKDG